MYKYCSSERICMGMKIRIMYKPKQSKRVWVYSLDAVNEATGVCTQVMVEYVWV